MKTAWARRGPAYILYDADLLANADAARFDAGGARVAGGRGAVCVARWDGLQVVVRHYRRGGLPARLVTDSYLWTGLRRTRAWREWHLLAAMYGAGLPVPRPVAARIVRRGLVWRADIATLLVPGARSLADVLARAPLEPARWHALGAVLRRFHAAGFCHADLNAHNVLADDEGRWWLVDFDRGRRRLPAAGWQQANLGRLRRSLDKHRAAAPGLHFGEEDWRALVAGYEAGG